MKIRKVKFSDGDISKYRTKRDGGGFTFTVRRTILNSEFYIP